MQQLTALTSSGFAFACVVSNNTKQIVAITAISCNRTSLDIPL